MNLPKLLIFHAVVTLAAGMVLIIAPSAIPQTVDLEIQPGQFLLCYFLAAAEFALAYLSFFSRNIKDPAVLRLVTITLIIFHGATLLLELLALNNGLSLKIMVNIAARIIIIAFFYFYGFVKLSKTQV